jgi:endonuclease YncB( thermonuclease family)
MPWTFSLEFLPCWWCKTLTPSFLHEGFPMRLLGLLLFTSLIFPLPDDFQGKVVSIADGDTVTVLRGREQVKVRLNGIDPPEKNQSFGTKSKDALAVQQPRGAKSKQTFDTSSAAYRWISKYLRDVSAITGGSRVLATGALT